MVSTPLIVDDLDGRSKLMGPEWRFRFLTQGVADQPTKDKFAAKR